MRNENIVHWEDHKIIYRAKREDLFISKIIWWRPNKDLCVIASRIQLLYKKKRAQLSSHKYTRLECCKKQSKLKMQHWGGKHKPDPGDCTNSSWHIRSGHIRALRSCPTITQMPKEKRVHLISSLTPTKKCSTLFNTLTEVMHGTKIKDESSVMASWIGLLVGSFMLS